MTRKLAVLAGLLCMALLASRANAAELRFGELFVRPVGPAGLELSARVRDLAAQTVRVTGYLAETSLPMSGRLMLVPVPIQLGDEDDHLADELPPQVIFIHLSGAAAEQPLPHAPGLVAVTGRLDLGPREEPDGHVSAVRLLLDADASQALAAAIRLAAGGRAHAHVHVHVHARPQPQP